MSIFQYNQDSGSRIFGLIRNNKLSYKHWGILSRDMAVPSTFIVNSYNSGHITNFKLQLIY